MPAAKIGHSKRRTHTAKRRNFSLFKSASPAKKTTSRRRRPRVANPVHHRRHHRRRNPLSTGTVMEGFKLGVSGMIIGFAQPMVRNLIGKFLPTGPIASAGVTLATAYGLGALAGFTNFTRSFKRPLELAGWTIVAAQVVSSYVLPAVSGFTSGLIPSSAGGATASGLGRTRGMRDIVTLPAGKYDPYFGATPAIGNSGMPSTGAKVATLKDVLTMNGMPGVSRG